MSYFDRLRAASTARDSLLCIGLDPDPRILGGGIDAALAHCRRVIDATADLACCYKPNAAFWEQYGPGGWEALATVRTFVPADVPVLLDCKRADVPNTMAAYAAAVFDAMQFDAATVHAYHGADSLAEFARYETAACTSSRIPRIPAAPTCSTGAATTSRSTSPSPSSRRASIGQATSAW